MGTCGIAEKPDGFGEIELFCCGKQAVSVVSKHVKLRRFTSARYGCVEPAVLEYDVAANGGENLKIYGTHGED